MKHPTKHRKTLAASGLLLCCVGCAPAPRPNVLLVSVDTLRADRLGSYGATTVETPTMDALAAGGVRFANAFTPVPLTLPAHWTLHTGLEPWRHGVVDNGLPAPAVPPIPLAERFRAAGYDTAGFVAASVLDATFGLDRGFAHYDHGPAADASLDQLFHATAPADERVGVALRWLSQRNEPKRPFFLWLHLFDAHAPYQPPAEYSRRYSDRPYDGEVAFVDAQLGRLVAGMERLGVADNTLIVLTSDHGESLGEHGEQTHGVLLYEATLRVPLIFRLPHGAQAGRVREDTATLADVAPTVAAIAGLQSSAAGDPEFDGYNLFTDAPRVGPRRTAAISESPRRRLGWASLVAIRDGPWKYIEGPFPELYNLDNDPGELHDQLAKEPGRVAGLASAAGRLEQQLRLQLAQRPTTGPTAEERAALAALGYVSQADAGSSHEPLRPDPKTVIASLATLDRAYQYLASGDLDRAEATFRSMADRPGLPVAVALAGLARVERLRGNQAAAEAAYVRLLEADPEALTAHAQLVLLARERGDTAAALDRARRLADLVPRDPAASRLLAEALAANGQLSAAEAEWARALAINPNAGWLRLSYARFLVSAARLAEAQDEIDRLLASPTVEHALRRSADELRRQLNTAS